MDQISFSKVINKSNKNHTGAELNLTSEYIQNQSNTKDNLKTRITNQAIELEKKKFKLALLKNKEKTYEELMKSFKEKKKVQNQIIKSLQQRVFENRINFSNELIAFAVNDITVTSVEVLENSRTSNEIIIGTGDSNQNVIYDDHRLDDDIGVGWAMASEYKCRDEDDKVFEDIPVPNEPKDDGRKVKFIFKKPKVSK